MVKPTPRALTIGLTLTLWWSSPAHSATWQSIGPDGGTVQALAFAPSNPQVAYAGTSGAGVFRSGDGGASWTAVSQGLGVNLSINSLAVSPRDPAVVYAGTNNGLYETTSGGASWRLLPLRSHLSSSTSVLALLIDPGSPRILYAATQDGLFRTADGGAHWAERDAGLRLPVSALALDPDHPGTLYASAFDRLSFSAIPPIYKSTDGGGSWTLVLGVQTSFVSALVWQRSTGTLYVSTLDGLFATRNGGATWAHPYSGEDLQSLVAAPSGSLYGGFVGRGVLVSTDGGRTWNDPAPVPPGPPFGAVLSLALDPSGDRLLTGTRYTGIYALDTRSGWAPASRGLRATDVTGLALSGTTLFAATMGEGVFASADGGASFSPRNSGILPPSIPPGEIDVFGLAANPRTLGSLAAGVSGDTVAQTSDGGRHWTTEASVCLPADRLALANPATIFVASSAAVLSGGQCPEPIDCTAKVSRDGGASFACLGGPQDVSAFLVDPLRPAIVYAADGYSLWKSTDRGGHFTMVNGNLGMNVLTLAASPAAHQTLYAGGDRGVIKSVDGGAHWSSVGPGLAGTTFALAVDPSNPALVYAASGVATPDFAGEAVFVSRDGGASWSLLGDGFPATGLIPALALDPARHVLYAATNAGGVWALSVP